MKLYRITAIVEVFAAYPSEPDSGDICSALRDHLNDCGGLDGTAAEITNASELPEEWRKAIPHGGYVIDRTCEQMV